MADELTPDIDRVAEAIRKADYAHSGMLQWSWEYIADDWQKYYRTLAEAALAAMEEIDHG